MMEGRQVVALQNRRTSIDPPDVIWEQHRCTVVHLHTICSCTIIEAEKRELKQHSWIIWKISAPSLHTKHILMKFIIQRYVQYDKRGNVLLISRESVKFGGCLPSKNLHHMQNTKRYYQLSPYSGERDECDIHQHLHCMQNPKTECDFFGIFAE